jgi:hypothetical protein
MFLGRFALSAVLLFAPVAAHAQSNPGFADGQPLTAAQLNTAFAVKSDFPLVANNVPGIGGVTFSGTPSAGYVPIATSPTAAAWGTTLNAPGGYTIAPAAATTNPGLIINQTPAGTMSAAINSLNGIFASNFNINFGTNIGSLFTVQSLMNGSNVTCGNGCFSIFADMQVAGTSATNNSAFTAQLTRAIAQAATANSGMSITGGNDNVANATGATGWTVVGREIDVTANATLPARLGLRIVLGPTDSHQGTQDAAINWAMAAGTSPGWHNLFLPDATNGTIMDSGAAIFSTLGSLTLKTGFDISGWTFSGAGASQYKGTGFFVDGAGNTKIGGNAIPTAGTLQVHTVTNENLLVADTAGVLNIIAENDAINATVPLAIAASNLQLKAPLTLTAAAPTVAAAQIGYGSTVTANTNCGTLAGSTGCVVINVAGTTRYLPYY